MFVLLVVVVVVVVVVVLLRLRLWGLGGMFAPSVTTVSGPPRSLNTSLASARSCAASIASAALVVA